MLKNMKLRTKLVGGFILVACITAVVGTIGTIGSTKIADGDTFFTAWRDPEWTQSSRERHEADEKNAYAYSFLTLDRAAA